jgi:hypothetical protein
MYKSLFQLAHTVCHVLSFSNQSPFVTSHCYSNEHVGQQLSGYKQSAAEWLQTNLKTQALLFKWHNWQDDKVTNHVSQIVPIDLKSIKKNTQYLLCSLSATFESLHIQIPLSRGAITSKPTDLSD